MQTAQSGIIVTNPNRVKAQQRSLVTLSREERRILYAIRHKVGEAETLNQIGCSLPTLHKAMAGVRIRQATYKQISELISKAGSV